MTQALSFTRLAVLLTLVTAGSQAAAKNLDGALAWVPGDATTLVAFDLEGAKKAEFFRDIQKQLIDLTGYGRDIAQMKRDGIDVMNSVKTVVFAGPDAALKKKTESVIILEGSFDQAKIKAFYEKKDKRPLTEKTSPIGPYLELGSGSFVMFDGNFLVFGTKGYFPSALAARQMKGGAKLTRIAALLGRVKSSKHGFGIIAGSDVLKKFLGKNFGAMKDVKEAALALDFSSGLSLSIIGVFPSAAKASEVAKVVEGEVKKLATDPELKEVGLEDALNKVQTRASGAELTIALALEGASAKAFASSLKELF